MQDPRCPCEDTRWVQCGTMRLRTRLRTVTRQGHRGEDNAVHSAIFFFIWSILLSHIYISSIPPPPHLVIPSEMSMATACVSGLFLITANFSSDNGQAVARLSLGNPIGDNCCATIATMFLRHPSSRRIGFEGQYAYVSGPVAFSVNSSTNTPYFDVRGASINPLTSYTPSSSDDEVSKFIDDSTAPPVLHGFQAYNFVFTTFHIVGIVVSVYGE